MEQTRRFTLLAMKPAWLALTLAGILALARSPLASAGEPASSLASTAAFMNPHTLNLDLDYRARRRGRLVNQESPTLLDLSPALQPLNWPRNSDMRARLLTPQLKRAPVVGWIAESLYRSRSENGWCLEVDPGDGEYLVLYRVHL
jgi:hypothetical protein